MRNGWTETTLGTHIKIVMGQAPPGKDCNKEGVGVPFVKAGEFTDGFPVVREWTTNPLRYSKSGDTLICVVGATCGKLSKGIDCAIGRSVAALQPLENLDAGFLWNFMARKVQEMRDSSRGSAQGVITKDDLADLPLNLPPLVEQKRIVDVVSSVDAYIDALQQQANTARTARNAVLHELLSAGGDDWTEITLGGVLLVSIGGIWGTDIGTDDLDVPVYRQTEFNDNGKLTVPSDAIRSISANQLKSRRIQPGDVLMQKSAGTPTLPGRVVQVPLGIEENATCSNFLQLLRADPSLCDPGFLFWELWSRHKSGGAFEFQRGTNIRNLDLNQYFAQPLNLPPLAEQKRIVKIVSSIDEVIQATEQAVADAKNLRSGLLSDLLSGEHEIPESYDRFVGAA
jgi:restriction endonuclease S subunit